ncbi:MAG TPA: tRNA preQ1(34) S-adenosylmethionine ribosyltransferase-isomerase QueA [Steroidobacteraceae bacterium]|jgi:S-adenosylmethionine:tRNA ribosyltransferase-isomerase|nr:tRNA preQ1(34) S-adenosylmethionine ribosyltransferase-isomerase QueA [Steroidobacteraceae bacterium]
MNTLTRRDFDFELPAELIAQEPLAERSASRLLLLDGRSPGCQDRLMLELPSLLRAGDLLVFNDTRVVPARLMARKPTGGKVELFLERPHGARRALVQLRDSKAVRPGMSLTCSGGVIQVITRQDPFWEVGLPQEVFAFFEAHGLVPLPPYIERSAEGRDRERYQSLLAQVPGAVAAPTASLHFDQPLLDRLAALGIGRTTITLHVGAGTFQPLRTEVLAEHRMHSERYEVPRSAADAIRHARATGGRIVAIGTTVARALESAAVATGAVEAAQGDTALFITPGFRFRAIDLLLTNFHLPQSTLLMLVAAFAGRDAVLDAYRHAVHERYRFFSYGDAMLVAGMDGAA